MQDRMCRLPRQSQQLRRSLDVPRTLQHFNRKGFEEKSEPRVLFSPRYLDRSDTAVRTVHARNPGLQNRLELHCVQVTPTTLRSMILQAASRSTLRTHAPASMVLHLNSHRLPGQFQLHLHHRPATVQSQQLSSPSNCASCDSNVSMLRSHPSEHHSPSTRFPVK